MCTCVCVSLSLSQIFVEYTFTCTCVSLSPLDLSLSLLSVFILSLPLLVFLVLQSLPVYFATGWLFHLSALPWKRCYLMREREREEWVMMLEEGGEGGEVEVLWRLDHLQ